MPKTLRSARKTALATIIIITVVAAILLDGDDDFANFHPAVHN